ncbi:MAG: hypothetical protein J6V71_00460 [Clostridia bacterium]|nr:hypothetical protein [Clostridia bacterium]
MENIEAIVENANKSLKIDKISTIGIITTLVLSCAYPLSFLASILFIIWKIYIRKKKAVFLSYSITPEERKIINEKMDPLKKIARSSNIWEIIQSKAVADKKYSAGATSLVKRINCSSSMTFPFPFKSNEMPICFKSKNIKLVFLPDVLFIIKGGKIYFDTYSNSTISLSGTRFVESEKVPSDAKVIDKTWKYVNKSGAADKRFSDNRQLPVCLYGKLTIQSKINNIVLMFSNSDVQNEL